MHSLFDGSRATIVGNIIALRTSTYGDGNALNMISFEVQDQTGSVPAVVWNDAFSTFLPILKSGATYKFINVNVRANARQENRLEMKIYADTRVEAHAPLKLVFPRTTLADMTDGAVHVRAAIVQKAEEVELRRSGEVRRIVLADSTGEVTALLEHQAVMAELTEGDAVEVDGKYVSEHRNGPTVYVHTIHTVEDDTLRAFWNETCDTHKAKKLKAESMELLNLADIVKADAGTRGTFKGMVRSCSLTPHALNNNRVKHSLSIVDDSMAAIDVGIFCDAATPFDVNIGDVVSMQGTVSSYNTKSITANAVEKLATDPLHEWWKTNSGAVFDELSYDSRAA